MKERPEGSEARMWFGGVSPQPDPGISGAYSPLQSLSHLQPGEQGFWIPLQSLGRGGVEAAGEVAPVNPRPNLRESDQQHLSRL